MYNIGARGKKRLCLNVLTYQKIKSKYNQKMLKIQVILFSRKRIYKKKATSEKQWRGE